MSYDISIWTKENPEVEEKEITFKEGLIFCEQSVRVETEDIPPVFQMSDEEIGWLTKLYVEPYPKDEELIKQVQKMAKEIAEKGNGFALDEQQGKIFGKMIPKLAFLKEKKKRYIWIHVYGVPKCAISDKRAAILKLFERYLPQALPYRYGKYEPPQYKYEENGKKEFLRFWKRNPSLVWYTTSPVEGVYSSDAYSEQIKGNTVWRCNCFSIQMLEEVWRDKKTRMHLSMVLVKLMVLLNGFYGEIIRGECETRGWFWKGIPNKRGEIFALGQPYTRMLGLSKKRRIQVFSHSDLKIPKEYCVEIGIDHWTGLPEYKQAEVWPF